MARSASKAMRGQGRRMKNGGRKPKAGKRQVGRRDSAANSNATLVNMPSPLRRTVALRRTNWVGVQTLTAADAGRAFSFALSDLPGYTELTAVYDSYRFKLVEWTIAYVGNNNFPTAAIATDFDNASTPSTLNYVLERTNTKLLNFSLRNTAFTLRFRPRPSSGGTSLLPPPGQWLDAATPTVPHYGLVGWYIDYNSTIGSGFLQVSETYHMEFAGQRG